MGYTTEFSGEFAVRPPLKPEDRTFLLKLAETRRVKRKLGPEFGVEGEFFVDGKGFCGQDKTPDIIDDNNPPKTQPGLWCQWVPNEDGTAIQWDGGEKFYEYIAWIHYLIERILKPRGYTLNGEVTWYGEEADDRGVIVVKNNKVFVQDFTAKFSKPRPFDPKRDRR